MEGHRLRDVARARGGGAPFIALLVSGGPPRCCRCPSGAVTQLLGETRDDAAGEAFDKVAKLLGLGYPGGPPIERAAATGDPRAYRFRRPLLASQQTPDQEAYYEFSFSGLKTAVRLATQKVDIETERANLARGFQDALIDTLVEKTMRAAREIGRTRVVLGGGVACNRTLVARMRERLAEVGATVYAPSARLATDNAAMIARAGLYRFEAGERASSALSAAASLPIPGTRTA